MNRPLKFQCACCSIMAGGLLATTCLGQVPLYSGCDANGEQVIDSTSLPANVIDDLTDHTYNKPVPVGQFSDCTIRRVFSSPIQSIGVTLVHLTTDPAVDSADDIGYVGNILVTPDSTNTPCFNEGSVLQNYNVTSQVVVNGNEATLLLRAQENCCCESGWGQDTRSDRVPARFRWEVVLQGGDELPTVTIIAADPRSGETGPSSGRFRVCRTGPTNDLLRVRYSVGGTAVPGSDYLTLRGRVTILPGRPCERIRVTPVDDAEDEALETVEVTLLPDSAYSVGSPSSATVNIRDND